MHCTSLWYTLNIVWTSRLFTHPTTLRTMNEVRYKLLYEDGSDTIRWNSFLLCIFSSFPSLFSLRHLSKVQTNINILVLSLVVHTIPLSWENCCCLKLEVILLLVLWLLLFGYCVLRPWFRLFEQSPLSERRELLLSEAGSDIFVIVLLLCW